MDSSVIVILVVIAIFAVGFIYLNFIFPLQNKKEEPKLEEQKDNNKKEVNSKKK